MIHQVMVYDWTQAAESCARRELVPNFWAPDGTYQRYEPFHAGSGLVHALKP